MKRREFLKSMVSVMCLGPNITQAIPTHLIIGNGIKNTLLDRAKKRMSEDSGLTEIIKCMNEKMDDFYTDIPFVQVKAEALVA